MAFVEELKKRKVARVGLAYLVGAWLGVQVASIALPAFDAPVWVLRVVILLVALGFPLALMLAWAVDLTPEGPRFEPGGTGWKRLLAFSAALGVLAVGWYVFGQPALRAKDVPDAAKTAHATAPPARSIAVLPFVNMSGDPANDYFSDGLAETTLDMLAQVRDLKVIARTSSFAFKGKPDDVRTIGRKLDAANLLEGSVQQAGQTVRITAQLVRTSDGVHLWSHRYDRQLTDVFKIQDEIATEVVKALQLALSKAEAARVTGKRTDDVGAYQEYLRGVALLPQRRVSEMRQALRHFQRAIELDPKYARAYGQAGVALFLLENYTGAISAQDKALREQYIATALKLDPALGEAYAARGALCETAGDFDCAVENYKRTTEVAPNYATGWQWYGELAGGLLGDTALARRLLTRARQLDPLSPVVRVEYCNALEADGDHAGAMRELEAVLRDNPRSTLAHLKRAQFYEMGGDLVGALREHAAVIAIDPESATRSSQRCDVMVDFGAFDEARKCIEAARGPNGEDFAEPARRGLAMQAGDYEQALHLSEHPRYADPWAKVVPLLALGRAREALALLQALEPGMFVQPEPRLTTAFPYDGLYGGAALLGAGAQAQGRDLVQRTLAANAARPVLRLDTGRYWSDVYGWALLGDTAKACAATREAAAAGLVVGLAQFDANPAYADLRKQACFREALAPVRAKAAAQVAAARAAGLL
jgi:TolB-like protein/Tfp pilus assembly protein PilF